MTALPNFLHRVGASQTAPVGTGCHGVELGATTVGGGGNASLILVGRIEGVTSGNAPDPTSGCPQMGAEYLNAAPSRVNGEVTAHETTHLWVHSQLTPTMDDQGHCEQERYQHDGLQCLMHKPYVGQGLYDGLVFLHYEGARGADSEYMWIRTAPDPVPMQ